jgi:hypothetical protein
MLKFDEPVESETDPYNGVENNSNLVFDISDKDLLKDENNFEDLLQKENLKKFTEADIRKLTNYYIIYNGKNNEYNSICPVCNETFSTHQISGAVLFKNSENMGRSNNNNFLVYDDDVIKAEDCILTTEINIHLKKMNGKKNSNSSKMNDFLNLNEEQKLENEVINIYKNKEKDNNNNNKFEIEVNEKERSLSPFLSPSPSLSPSLSPPKESSSSLTSKDILLFVLRDVVYQIENNNLKNNSQLLYHFVCWQQMRKDTLLEWKQLEVKAKRKR